MNNYLYNELCKACDKEGINPTVWAEKNNISTGTPTQLKRGVRPTIQTLGKLISFWKDKKTQLSIATAYLKDEIERLGFSLDAIQIVDVRSPVQSNSTLDDDLKIVQRFMKDRPIRESMHALAELLRAAEDNPEAAKLMAEAENAALLQRMRKKRKKQAS